jgi:nitric oxide reductase NorE protein
VFEIESGFSVVNAQAATARMNAARMRRVPAEAGIWIFILLDMLIFAEMFAIFVWYRAENRDLFKASQQLVNPAYGLIYTLLLLTSSWCVVLAVIAAKNRLFGASSKLVLWAFGLGAAFVAIKLVEYGAKLSDGITPTANEFFMFYFVLTFVHLLHASVGLGVLLYLRSQVHALQHSRCIDQSPMRMIETSGVYWHMVDLIWLVLFALFYLKG